MADVARKAIDANGYNNGTRVVSRGPSGNYDSKVPVINRTEPVATIESRYTDRFDNVRYYTGDSPTDV